MLLTVPDFHSSAAIDGRRLGSGPSLLDRDAAGHRRQARPNFNTIRVYI
ncbi:hypothetical protein [Caballeronia sp. ATUFL_M2_KS44]|nr:hypothetical protein [Caballeronia sp. ATUFL_M2_KS44]